MSVSLMVILITILERMAEDDNNDDIDDNYDDNNDDIDDNNDDIDGKEE